MSSIESSENQSQSHKIPKAVAEVFGIDETADVTNESSLFGGSSSMKRTVKPISRLAEKSLIELTKELQKVQLEKGELVMKNYSEEQNGVMLTLYGKTSEKELARLAELNKLEAELTARIKEMKNAT